MEKKNLMGATAQKPEVQSQVTFIQSAGGATINRSELIDFLKERNYTASIEENRNIRIGITNKIDDEGEFLNIFEVTDDFGTKNEVWLRIGKRITASLREKMLHFIDDYFQGNLEYGKTWC